MNSELRPEYYENVDKLTDKQKEIEVAKKGRQVDDDIGYCKITD